MKKININSNINRKLLQCSCWIVHRQDTIYITILPFVIEACGYSGNNVKKTIRTMLKVTMGTVRNDSECLKDALKKYKVKRQKNAKSIQSCNYIQSSN